MANSDDCCRMCAWDVSGSSSKQQLIPLSLGNEGGMEPTYTLRGLDISPRGIDKGDSPIPGGGGVWTMARGIFSWARYHAVLSRAAG
jgi:hypothetical protein